MRARRQHLAVRNVGERRERGHVGEPRIVCAGRRLSAGRQNLAARDLGNVGERGRVREAGRVRVPEGGWGHGAARGAAGLRVGGPKVGRRRVRVDGEQTRGTRGDVREGALAVCERGRRLRAAGGRPQGRHVAAGGAERVGARSRRLAAGDRDVGNWR
jgi:hypothetical protein